LFKIEFATPKGLFWHTVAAHDGQVLCEFCGYLSPNHGEHTKHLDLVHRPEGKPEVYWCIFCQTGTSKGKGSNGIT